MSKPIPPLGQPPLTPAVFHILLADGPRHGYAIMQAVEESAGTEMRMGPGTIYGSLQRMEEAGLVREVSADGHDRRRMFVLQPFGRRALDGSGLGQLMPRTSESGRREALGSWAGTAR